MEVVAVSGVSGSGKTSVIKQLVEKLDCPYLLFDDHTDENTYPTDMKAWFESGADLSEIKTPKFVDSLREYLQKCDNDYIFIEEPFGRQRPSISSFVDQVILLDQPMEVCLSRVIMRNLKHPSSDSLISIPKYLAMYDDHFREIYIALNDQTRENSDLVLQDVLSVKQTTECIIQWLRNNRQ